MQQTRLPLRALISLLPECLQRLQGVNRVIKRVAIRVAHPSNLKFPVSGSMWRPGEGKGRMHSHLLIGSPLDSNCCVQKQEGGRGCLVPALLPTDGRASTDVAAAGWATPQRSL